MTEQQADTIVRLLQQIRNALYLGFIGLGVLLGLFLLKGM
jgi:hypothetical protein